MPGSAAILAVLESITDAVFVVDTAWRFVYLNPRAEALFGRPRAALLGARGWDVFPEVVGTGIEEAYRRAMTSGVAVAFEAAYPGGDTWFEVRAYPSPAGLAVYFQDITPRKVAEAALRAREARLRAQYQAFPLPTYTWRHADGDFVFAEYNAAADAFARGALAARPGGRASALYRDYPTVIEHLAHCFASGATLHHELCYRSPATGADTDVVVTYVPVPPDLVVMHSEDVTARRAAEAALRESEGRYRALVEQAPDGICVFDEGGRFFEVNARACAMLGYAREELLGLGTVDVIAPTDLAARPLPPLAVGGGSLLEERLMRRKDGTTFPAEASVTRLPDGRKQAILRDIGERKRLEARLAHQATHDPLTGLPNRALFHDRLGQALARGRRNGGRCAVLCLDLDHFKDVNDTLGHDAGDRLLREIAARLSAALRDEDTVARLGGDEFAVLLAGDANVAGAIEVADRILRALAPPVVLDGRRFSLAASIGVVVGGPGYARTEEVLRDADIAMYRVKGAGRGGYALFHPGMHIQLLARVALEEDLRRALERGEFALHYQPIVELATGRVAEVEALVRWECPGEGLILPGRFLAVLEGMGLARELGRWVLGMACRQARAWESRHGAAAPTVAVNLSAAEFDQPGLADEVAAALVEADLAPERLRLEITEGMAMRDAERALGTCQALGTLGVRLALDDFGTGHSSLAHLRRLPINTLKIDRAFVRDAATGAAGLEICRTIVALARALGLGVVAEGIETVEQAHLLAATGAQWG